MRNLAARSAKAAKETEQLIASSVSKTERGTVIADRTAVALKEIGEVSAKVSDLVNEIATASQEQALGIGQINQGLAQIDQVNQQTTANTEESAASAAVLANHAHELQNLLRQFKLDRAGGKAGGMKSPESPMTKPSRPKLLVSKSAKPRAPAVALPASKGEQWGDFESSPSPIIALNDDEFGKY